MAAVRGELAAARSREAAKDERIDLLLVQIAELTAQVQALVLRLSKDSSTSSKPPSSDGPGKRPRGGSSRTRSGREPGKQPGDPGTTLRQADDPDERIPIPAPAVCAGCDRSLIEVPVSAVRRRQVFDLTTPPPPRVTEYAADIKCCPGCGKKATGCFPDGVASAAQYGPEITTKVADAVLGHHIPVHRSTLLVMELCGMKVSAGFAASLRAKAARLLESGFLPAVRALLAGAPVVHADETFTRAAARTAFLHVASTQHLTLMHTGDRSAATIDAGDVLPHLSGVLVRDGYAGYTHLDHVLHAWCGAHLLRDLRGIHESDPQGQLWARAMADALLEANRFAHAARDTGREELSAGELRTINRLYTGALARSRQDNRGLSTALAGHARTLAARFEQHRDVILRFSTDLAVPFTNNQAERDIRPAKVQQRSSGGCWRTLEGLADFAIVQSYLSTASKWGIGRYDALKRLFTTGAWIPHALTPDTTAA
ncbi:IS66 family transposase [Streptomyces sp. NBC_01314]|uniref:IS66 family transposase n=1 Tax=Streptomyces sp. NBC_01314 TaxID=2903821 RepID=UPI00308B1982|nr:IS66 family transposase [Streptomyces sp. NBC_01314]